MEVWVDKGTEVDDVVPVFIGRVLRRKVRPFGEESRKAKVVRCVPVAWVGGFGLGE